jgi:acetyl esterase
LAPENPYPTAINDAEETVKYVFENAKHLNIDFKKTVITGDSAGGHLTLVTALSLVDTPYQVAGIFPFHPVTQGASIHFRSHFLEDKYLMSRSGFTKT